MSDPSKTFLEKLSEGEREILQLLGEGHTAKSIAQRTRRSVSSVNEHLRRARRKTGANSSRELARLLRDENFVDEKFGLPPTAPTSQGWSSRFIRKGALAMTILFAATIADAMLFQPAIQSQSPGRDPLLEKLYPHSDTEPRALAKRLRAEARNAAWAEPSEAALRAYYATLLRSDDVELVRIACGSTVCEVVGKVATTDPKSINAAMMTLQVSRGGPTGMRHASVSFSGELFAVHWLREPSCGSADCRRSNPA